MSSYLGKTLIVAGLVIVVMGLVLNFLPKNGPLPKLPGDIYIKKDNFTFYFPWVSSIIISIVLSVVFYLFFRK